MTRKSFVILLIIIGGFVYFQTLLAPFVWDDEEFILNNPLIRTIANLPLFFLGNSLAAGGSQLTNPYYRPVMTTINAALYTIFGPRAFFFHLFQAAAHIASAIVVFLLFDRFFRQHRVLSFLLALVFLVHPMNVEAAAFISAAQEVLYVLAGLLALFFINDIFLSVLFLLTSLLIKETGLIFAPIILIYTSFYQRQKLPRYLASVAGVVGFYLLLRWLVSPVNLGSAGLFPIMRATSMERLMSLPSIAIFYLKTFFFPAKLAIARHWVVRSASLNEFFLPLLSSLIFFALLVFFLIKRKTRTGWFFFFWLVIGFVPHLQLIPLNMTVAERWFYGPMIGMLGMIGVIVESLKLKVKSGNSVFLIIVIIVILSLRTIVRTFNWKDELTLYRHDIKIDQHTFDLENNLGVALFRRKDYKKARAYFEKSVRTAPYWWVNWNNLGAVYERRGELKQAEKMYKQAIQNGDYYLAYENYVFILLKQKQFEQAKEFLEKKALKKFPQNERLLWAYTSLDKSRDK